VVRERGFRIDEEKFTAEVAVIRREPVPPEVSVIISPNAVYLDESLVLVALAAAGVERSSGTDSEIYRILSGRHVPGLWTSYPVRVPLGKAASEIFLRANPKHAG
jgi:hypothetical protein